MKKIILAVVVALLIIGGGAFAVRQLAVKNVATKQTTENDKKVEPNQEGPLQVQLQKIRVATQKNSIDANSIISYAKETGLFSKQGLDVELLGMDKTPFDTVVSGDADVFFGGNSRPLIAYFNGVDSRIILNAYHPFGYYAMSRFPKGQEASIKKVGIDSVKGENQQMATLALQNLGVDPKKVEFIAAPTVATKLSMLQQGQIDMYVFSSRKIYEDNAELAKFTLYGSDVMQKNSTLMRSLVTTQKNIDEKGPQLKTFTVALQNAIQDVEKNKEPFLAFLKKENQYNDAQALDVYEQFVFARKDVRFMPDVSAFEQSAVDDAKKESTESARELSGFLYPSFVAPSSN